MLSGGRLSREQKGKEVAAAPSPARDTSGVPLDEFEQVHREAMMDTRSLELSQRILVSESARLHRREIGGAPSEPQICERDGSSGAGDEVPLVNYVQTCYYPREIFEEIPTLAPEFLRSSDVSGQAWENIIKTRSTPDSVKRLLRERTGAGGDFPDPLGESEALVAAGRVASMNLTFKMTRSFGFVFLA